MPPKKHSTARHRKYVRAFFCALHSSTYFSKSMFSGNAWEASVAATATMILGVVPVWGKDGKEVKL
jgi:hypothetical protein